MVSSFSQSLAAFLAGQRKTAVQAVSLLLVFFGAAILTIQSYRAIDHDLTEAALSRREANAYLAATIIREKFDRLADLGVSFATRVRFRTLVNEEKWDDAIEILRSAPKDFPFIERVFLADSSGNLMADIPRLPGVRGRNFSERDWYQGVSSNWRPYLSNVYTRAAEPQLNVVAMAVPIVVRSGAIAGILVLQVTLSAFTDWMQGIDVGEGGQVYLVDRNGTAAKNGLTKVHGELNDLSAVPAVKQALRGTIGVEVLFDPAVGEDRLAAYSPVERYGWGVVIQQPTSVAFGPRDRLLRSVVIAYAWTLVLLVGVVYLISRVVSEQRHGEAMRRTAAELEERVAERTAELAESNRELESFSYSVSHDLRTPLRAIDGYSRILDEDYGSRLDSEGKRLLAVVQSNVTKMGQLIDDLLAFSRMGRTAMKMAEIDMEALVGEVIEDLGKAANTGAARLIVRPMARAWGDRALIRQVWINLLTNALKFSSKVAGPEIVVGCTVEEQHIVYFVQDNGAGFDMAYYHRLFAVFQRLHSANEFGGTGVGLAIVQRVVSRHGGRVWAESQVNAGATFFFSLPRRDHNGNSLPEAPASAVTDGTKNA